MADPLVEHAAGKPNPLLGSFDVASLGYTVAEAYDGFLVHSRFGPAAPLDGSSMFDEVATEVGSITSNQEVNHARHRAARAEVQG